MVQETWLPYRELELARELFQAQVRAVVARELVQAQVRAVAQELVQVMVMVGVLELARVQVMAPIKELPKDKVAVQAIEKVRVAVVWLAANVVNLSIQTQRDGEV